MIVRTKSNPYPSLELLPVSTKEPTTLAEAVADIIALRHNMRSSSFLFGLRLRRVRDLELWAQDGSKSMEQWFRKACPDLSIRTMYRAMAFVDAVPGEVAGKYDPDKIVAGVRLLRRHRGKDAQITLQGLEALTIRAERDGKHVQLRFKDATVQELEDEAARKRLSGLPEAPPQVDELVSHVDRRLGSGATRVGTVRKQRQGSRHVVVITVDEDKVDEFRKLLR